MWTGCIWLRTGTCGRILWEYDDEFSCSLQGGHFLHYLSDDWLFKKGSAPWNLFYFSVERERRATIAQSV
jgi:hypothetical protein